MKKKVDPETNMKIRVYTSITSCAMTLNNITEPLYNYSCMIDFDMLKKIFNIMREMYVLDYQLIPDDRVLTKDIYIEIYDPLRSFVMYGERFEDEYDLISLIFIIKEQSNKILISTEKKLNETYNEIGLTKSQDSNN